MNETVIQIISKQPRFVCNPLKDLKLLCSQNALKRDILHYSGSQHFNKKKAFGPLAFFQGPLKYALKRDCVGGSLSQYKSRHSVLCMEIYFFFKQRCSILVYC